MLQLREFPGYQRMALRVLRACRLIGSALLRPREEPRLRLGGRRVGERGGGDNADAQSDDKGKGAKDHSDKVTDACFRVIALSCT